MRGLKLQPNERRIAKIHDIKIKDNSFNIFITNKKLILESNSTGGSDLKSIALSDIVSIKEDNFSRDFPSIELAVKSSNGDIRKMFISYPERNSASRSNERDKAVSTLNNLLNTVIYDQGQQSGSSFDNTINSCTGVSNMDQIIVHLNGVNGQIELYDDKIIIRRKGIRSKLTQGMFKGDKSIYLDKISGIQVKPAGNFVNGYIQFTLSGGKESTAGISDAIKDENSVFFLKKDNEIVNNMKMTIENIKREKTQSSGIQLVSQQISGADEIRKYKSLMDEGLISLNEFEMKKKEILKL